MCGIIGTISIEPKTELVREVVTGLKRLEYRGYDSWGYAVQSNGRLRVEKKKGHITSPSMSCSGSVAVGHTRWATHGGVTDENAHPHTDCTGKIAIVHNGIIENYLELREQLANEGHEFKSQTDSEVVAHLIEKATGDLFSRAKQVALQLRGAFSLVITSVEYPHQLVAIKNESPLVIGVTGNEAFFASDPLAFLDKTNKAVFLTEGDIALAQTENGEITFKFYNYINQAEVRKQPVEINWQAQEAELGQYAHFMLKEIMEQPRVMQRALDMPAAEQIARQLKGKNVYAIGCGTARHAAVIGKHILHKVAKFNMEVMMAHEFYYFIDDLPAGAVILAVSQSGETADVLQCTRKAKQRGLTVLSIVNVPSSSLARESYFAFLTNCGPEIAVASTKAFTNQILAFYQIAFALAGKPHSINAINPLIKQLEEQLPYFDSKAREVAQYLQHKQHVYMLGKGVNFPIALEGSLKLKEISYIHAEGMPAGELKHGTLSLIENGTPVILLSPSDYTYNDSISNGLETKARGAYLIGISDRPHPSFDAWIQLPQLSNESEIFYPLFEVTPLQLIAYHTALLLERNIDKPRNLAKSCTVK